MKAIVVRDRDAGVGGLTLTDLPHPHAAENARPAFPDTNCPGPSPVDAMTHRRRASGRTVIQVAPDQ